MAEPFLAEAEIIRTVEDLLRRSNGRLGAIVADMLRPLHNLPKIHRPKVHLQLRGTS